jgi:Holliday junction resolvase RusA-like endonuclease
MVRVKFMIDPVAKGRPRVGNGRVFTPAKTRVFENTIKVLAMHYAKTVGFSLPLIGPLEVTVMFHIKKPKTVKREIPEVKPDLDNLVKGLFDGINGTLWHDDAQVVMLACSKMYTNGPGYIELLIKSF